MADKKYQGHVKSSEYDGLPDRDIQLFEQTLKQMQENFNTITTMWSRISHDYVTLKKENVTLKKENVVLKKENEAVKKAYDLLQLQISETPDPHSPAAAVPRSPATAPRSPATVHGSPAAVHGSPATVPRRSIRQPQSAPITFGTMNFDANGEWEGESLTYERSVLLRRFITETDVVAVQEFNSKTAVAEFHKETHHILYKSSSNTGMLLKKSKFPSYPSENPNYQYFKWEKGRFFTTKATPRGWKKSVLMVSYWGNNTEKEEAKLRVITEMVKKCLEIKQRENADCLMIAGDFNVGVELVKNAVLPQIETGKKLRVTTVIPPAVSDKSVRHGKSLIDFFIYDASSLEVGIPQRKPFSDEELADYELSYNRGTEEYKTLKQYLDHDPIVTTVAEIP